MTREGWRALVVDAMHRFHGGNGAQLELLSRLLEEQDQARAVLRRKGYGETGMGWLDLVAEVPRVDGRQ
jgi:hypothetical protein